MKFVRKAVLAGLAALALMAPAAAAERAIIVLDGSGSMWAQIDGEARITIARDTLSEVLSTVPSDLELGLMTYGHREKGNCGDIEMMVAPAAGTASAISSAAAKINPKGMTPLSDAVRIAAEELRYTEDKATVILITDGLETCEVDVCALGVELENQGIDFTAHVLGFGLSDEEGRQVACLAENTGGKYLSANDGAGLVDALTTAVVEVAQVEPEPGPKPEPAPVAHEYNIVPTASLAEGGPDLFDDRADLVWRLHDVAPDGGRGEMIRTEYNSNGKFSVEPGDYYLMAKFGYAEVLQPISVGEGELVEPHFLLNAAVIKVTARRQEGENPSRDIGIRLHFPGDESTQHGEGTFRVPAGDMRMVTYVDAIEVEESFSVAAGETIEKDIVLGSASVLTSAVYVEGSEVTASGLSTRIYKAKKALDGTREEVSFGYGPEKGFDLPPGDYVAVFELEFAIGEAAFSLASGDEIQVVGTLDAGVVAFTVPGIESARIFEAKKSIDGTRKDVATFWYEDWQRTFNAGDYVIVTELEDGTEFEVPFTVVAGERLELQVEPRAGTDGGKTKTK